MRNNIPTTPEPQPEVIQAVMQAAEKLAELMNDYLSNEVLLKNSIEKLIFCTTLITGFVTNTSLSFFRTRSEALDWVDYVSKGVKIAITSNTPESKTH